MSESVRVQGLSRLTPFPSVCDALAELHDRLSGTVGQETAAHA